jgi:hypothetical protein
MEWKWFAAGIVIALAAAAFLIFTPDKQEPILPSREIVAIASGQAIYKDDVSAEISRMAVLGAAVPEEDALNVIIRRDVLTKEAANQGIYVKGSETQQEYKSFLAGRNFTTEQFGLMLIASNVSQDYFVSVLGQELTVKKLVESQVPAQFLIKYNDVLTLYNERFNGTNVSFDSAEKNLTDELTLIKREEYKQDYIAKIMSKAEVVIFS